MNNVLFISYDGLTDPLGQSQIIPYLAGLTKYGFKFTIISCDKPLKFNHLQHEIRKILAPYPIKWVSIPYHKYPPVISSMYDLWLIKKKAVELHRQENFDMVHTRAGTPALAGLWLKKKYGIRFLNDIRDFYAQSRIDSGSWKQSVYIYRKVFRYFQKKEQEAIRLSDGIVCLTEAARQIIKEYPFFGSETPLQVIPCSVDMDLFDPQTIEITSKAQLQKELGIQKNDFVMSYLGSTGSWYLTDQMMTCCRILADKIPHFKLLFITPEGAQNIYNAAAKAGLSKDKVIVTSAARQQVPALLSLSRYSLFFIKPCASKKASSPTKQGEIMAMGIPVITNHGVGDVSDIVRKYRSGFVLEDLNESRFEKLAQDICSASNFDPVGIREGATACFALDKAVRKYAKIYRSILNNQEGFSTLSS